MADEDKEKIQCREAADLIADALLYAGIIQDKDLDRATEIAEEEIIVRKSMGKL